MSLGAHRRGARQRVHETGIDLADLRAPLDDEERSRVDVEDDYTMIIVDIPTVEERGGRDWYETIRCRCIITQSAIITVCMQDTPVLHPFMEGTIRGFNTYMKTRFILQILYRNATMYLRYLRIIDRESDKLELKLRHSMQNREIVMLMELSKTLVYFTTSLKSNEIVMEKLTTLPRLKGSIRRTRTCSTTSSPKTSRLSRWPTSTAAFSPT